MIIELSLCGHVYPIGENGKTLTGAAFEALADCTKSGDCEPACQFILDHCKPEFTIIKRVNGNYDNVNASVEDKRAVCREIYGPGISDDSLDLYLVWQAAHNAIDENGG